MTDATLQSTPDQKAAHFRRTAEELAAYINSRRATNSDAPLRPMPPAPMIETMQAYADDAGLGESVREMIEAIAVVRQKKLKAEAKAPKKPGRFSHEPTVEREANAPHGIRAEKMLATSAHRVMDYVDKHREDFTAEELSAIDWVRQLAETYHRHKRITANYEGVSGGGNPANQLGGLGNVPQSVRNQFAMFEYLPSQMPPQFWQVIDAIIIKLRFADREITAQELGAMLFPRHRDKSFRSGATAMAVKGAAWVLLRIMHRERALTRPTSPPRRVVQIMTEPVE